MKRFCLWALAALLLAGCGGGSSTTGGNNTTGSLAFTVNTTSNGVIVNASPLGLSASQISQVIAIVTDSTNGATGNSALQPSATGYIGNAAVITSPGDALTVTVTVYGFDNSILAAGSQTFNVTGSTTGSTNATTNATTGVTNATTNATTGVTNATTNATTGVTNATTNATTGVTTATTNATTGPPPPPTL